MPPPPLLRLVEPLRGAAAAAAAVRREAPPRGPGRPHLGPILLEAGALAPADLLRALAIAARGEAALPDILRAHGMVDEAALARGLAAQWGTGVVDPCAAPPDPRLIDRLGAETCLRTGLLPWRRAGDVTIVLAARPEAFERRRAELEAALGPVALAVAPDGALTRAVLEARPEALNARAEALVPAAESARAWDAARLRRLAAAAAAGLVLSALLAAESLLIALTAWAVLSLLAVTGLRAAAAVLRLTAPPAPPPGAAEPPPAELLRLPVISILVPLHREPDIAPRLVARLGRLDYPRELLDVLLVVEEEDLATRRALETAGLPPWMRIFRVPAGGLKTKPRALNHALLAARGSIIGVYDAEDAPEPDQLRRVVRGFAARGPAVVCLQGVLDYYNPRTNWIARCFTIEYATWFRILLPGLARMGMPVPLGGTTLFFRREALERLGCWDAHNVTEDADLGIRLARRGLRTEMLDSVTGEEANCRVLPWVRQRSRWLKGFAMTWAVHMRDPRRLWRELGPAGFAGFQILFLGGVSQYLLAPLLLSLWLLAVGLPHPLAGILPPAALAALIAAMVAAEAVNLAVGLLAVSGPRHRHLMPWVPSLPLYFPLGTLAAWKALWEMAVRPFYWDKTAHGLHDAAAAPVGPAAPEGGGIATAGSPRRRVAGASRRPWRYGS